MMAQAKSSLEVVEEWREKCFKFFTKSDDALASTMVKLLDAMSYILKRSENSRVQRALAFLEYERSINMLSENTAVPSIRTMMYGVLQSIHGTLLDMMSSKYYMASEEMQADKIPDSSQSLPSKPREELVEVSKSIPNNDQVLAEDLMAFKEEEVAGDGEIKEAEMNKDGSPSLNDFSVIPNFTPPFPIEPKEEMKEIKEEEMIDDFVTSNYYNELPIKPKEESNDEFQEFPYDNQIEGEDSSAKNTIANELEQGQAIDKSKNIDMKRKSSNKGVSDLESSTKKRREKRNTRDLECPECEYCTRSVDSWVKHLKNSHSTTPTLAGLALLCDCGNESASNKHNGKCDVANFTVIRKREGPILETRMTPQCVLCEVFPKSIRGYTRHLRKHHNSTPKQNNIYLKCSCGTEFINNIRDQCTEHVKKCDSLLFTLHILE